VQSGAVLGTGVPLVRQRSTAMSPEPSEWEGLAKRETEWTEMDPTDPSRIARIESN
jgi:hypothetical protein